MKALQVQAYIQQLYIRFILLKFIEKLIFRWYFPTNHLQEMDAWLNHLEDGWLERTTEILVLQ